MSGRAKQACLSINPTTKKFGPCQADFLFQVGLNSGCTACKVDKKTVSWPKMSMITAAQWVPRGFAAPFPKKYTLDESEFARIAELAKLQLDDAEEDLKEAQEEEGSDGQNQKADNDESMDVEGEKPTTEAKFAALFEKSYKSGC